MREIRRILDDLPGLRVLDLNDLGIDASPDEDALEPFDSFEENALSKASYFQRKAGIATVADDSGIEVDVLDGAPGVRSKRFAVDSGMPGADRLDGLDLDLANNRCLVEGVRAVAPEERTARYVCVAVLMWPDGSHEVFRGEAPGLIVEDPQGEGGFGYDPHVLDVALGKTFAEMTGTEKDARSHRGAAFRQLRVRLEDEGTAPPTEET